MPGQAVRLPCPRRRAANQQPIGAAPAPIGDIPKGDQRIPLGLGRPGLRRSLLGHRYRHVARPNRIRRDPHLPRWRNSARRALKTPAEAGVSNYQDHIDLYEHIDDPAYIAKEETFESWYENPIDLPGRWYLQAITQLFKENRLARGTFVGLGRNLRNITCPLYLLAGAADDITTPEQVLGAKNYVGTPKDRIVEKTVPGGHIGLFMGSRTLKESWPEVARWIAVQ